MLLVIEPKIIVIVVIKISIRANNAEANRKESIKIYIFYLPPRKPTSAAFLFSCSPTQIEIDKINFL